MAETNTSASETPATSEAPMSTEASTPTSSDADAPSARSRGSVLLLLALLAAALVFGLALPGDFVLDDIPAVTRSTCVTGPLSLTEIFSHNFWCQDPAVANVDAWRPLPVLAWNLAWKLGGGDPFPFHLLGWLAHLACVALVWRLGQRLSLPTPAPALAALLFALMPIHVDAVASIVGFADVLSTLGVLVVAIACLAPRRASWALVALGSLIALGAKESGAIIAPLAILAWLLAPRFAPRFAPKETHESKAKAPAHLRPLLAALAIALTSLALLARARVLGSWTAQHITFGVNPLLDAPASIRLTAPFGLWTHYLQVALLGTPLSADHSYDAIPLTGPEGWLRAALGLAIVLFLATWAVASWRRRQATRAWLIAWLLGAGALACQLFTLLPAIYAERLFYGASVPLTLLAAETLAPLLQRRLPTIALLAYLTLQATLSAAHTHAWTSEDGITAITVAASPRSARAQVWRTRVLLRAGEPERALIHADIASDILPDWGIPDALAGSALDSLDRPAEAAQRFAQATKVAPQEPEVADLAIQFLLRYGHRAQARAIYARHQQARGGAPVPWVTRP
ncbi:hypothetical protein G6O69_10675 [Pseudenhygromyxa sp. WMMC2535]|uniref:hypothetical protein n=1 Tax=Pseudenhygromyxa sp. WMMC2535 TaxID=2712867 RepID=UPI0015546506|nr:hypothetical protein [Pseudenhygromyxa sp. WMMC2535]NVB38296.1 hypothetical protein [Pseudenhygromyxa sp. WMMC2535]